MQQVGTHGTALPVWRREYAVRYLVYATCVAGLFSAAQHLSFGLDVFDHDPLSIQLHEAFLEALKANHTLGLGEPAVAPRHRRPAAERTPRCVRGPLLNQSAAYEATVSQPEEALVPDGPLLLFSRPAVWPDHGWQRYGLNISRSDQLPLRRHVPDTRAKRCHHRSLDSLPAASVVVVFHNEGLSVLLRTVQSVLDRSPPPLLHELLLVDDFSSFDDLAGPLRAAVTGLGRVRLLRTARREGLIRAKNVGALAAAGDVIVFLDAHCEVNRGWLPPLLAAVASNRRTVAVPVLDWIDGGSFQYRSQYGATGGQLARGVFDWSLRYKERALTATERQPGSDDGAPYSTASHSGGILAISRWWFFYLGGYDPQLLGWGAENMELSFKTWMCGGDVLIVPCSRVGHVYRHRTPYSFGDLTSLRNGPIITTNFLRVAHVWMDRHVRHFLTEQPSSAGADYGDVTDRQLLRRRLACRSFDWYLATVVPELPAVYPAPPPNVAWGQIVHDASGLCVGIGVEVEPHVQTVGLHPCSEHDQIFRLNTAGRLMEGELCAGFMPSVDSVVVSFCPSLGRVMTWTYHQVNRSLEHSLLKSCLAATLAPPGDEEGGPQVAPLGRLRLGACEPGSSEQAFSWRQPAVGRWAPSRLTALRSAATSWWYGL